MGISVLENEELLVEISNHGAELSRIYDKRNGRERLYDANPEYWNRHAPVLFPMVGASFNKKYRYGGKEYTMGQHGFARDSEFELLDSSDHGVSYILRDNEETIKNYPFHFELKVTHRLDGRNLIVEWCVKNIDEKELLFNIGAHPAFLLGDGVPFSRVSLDFNTDKPLTYFRIEDPGSGCCFTDKPYTLPASDGVVKLNDDFFSEGVYIFQDSSVTDVILSVDDVPQIRISAPGFPYFGVWSKKGAPFICLEPWHGRTDCYGFNGDLSEKEGIIKLSSGEEFNTSLSIQIL